MRTLLGIILGLFLLSPTYADDFTLKSPVFDNNGKIPTIYTCDGKNFSPELNWSGAPVNTQSFMLILSSPDWAAGKVNLWILYNIPKNLTQLPEKANRNLPDGISVADNYYNDADYSGPCPPDDKIHHYVFTLYALDTILDLPGDPDLDDILDKAENHIIKQTTLTATYSH